MRKLILRGAAACALAASSAVFGSAAQATVTITFDTPQAGYTPSAQFVTQDISDQFASLGILFRTTGNYALGATVGDCTGGVGSDPVHLYGSGSDYPGCGDTTPNIDFLFVDPTNSAVASFTTAFSLLVTDGSGTVLTAYDALGNVLGIATATSGFNERIGISGVGDIARVNVTTPADPTAYDDLQFADVASVGAVPEPGTWAMMLLGFGTVGFAMRRSARRRVHLLQIA
jgi:hypothetical protein